MIFSRIGSNSKKHFLYYGLFSLIFVIFHLGLVSIFSFFHFLLDHDLNTIEDWLSLNGWEILVASKFCSFGIVLYILKMNNYKNISWKLALDQMEIQPHRKIFSVILFILFFFSTLVHMFGDIREVNEINIWLFLTAYLCSALFYIIDFSMIFLLEYFFEPKPRSFKVRLISMLLMFLVSVKISQPFSSGYELILILHFVALYYFCRRKHLSNGLLYAFFVISPLAAVYGLDIVWNSDYSIIQFSKQVPILGILGIWIIALSYFHRSRMN